MAAMRRINPRLLDAARLLETSRLRTWLLVRLPLLAPGLLASTGLVFCLTLSELSATLLVAPPGQSTLTLRLYNYLHYGASETVAGLTLVLTGLVLAFALLAAIALALWTRLTTVPQAKESRP
jgi:iron(III) transport system permease protein